MAINTLAPSDTTLASFIWKNADDLWGDFKQTDFGKTILPFTLLRRLECVLEPTRDKVLDTYAAFRDKGLDTNLILRQSARPLGVNEAFLWMFIRGVLKKVRWCHNRHLPSPRVNNLLGNDT